jgi:glycosyltransferase involved in cell wall biosynthesis
LSTLDADAVSVVQNGLNYPYAPMPGALVRERLSRFDPGEKLKAGFILHIGGNQWYKNRIGVIQIYAQLCRKTAQPPCLLMVGKPFTTAMRRCVAANHLEDRVIELNAVSNEDLRTIYCAAQLLLFPSLAEGFGWPIVEAQACGCRVVTTNQPPMNDIGGDAAVYINLESPASTGDAVLSAVVLNDAAEAVLQLLRESSEAKRSRIERGLRNAAKFSTAKMVDDYVGLYQKALALPVEADRHAPALSLVN